MLLFPWWLPGASNIKSYANSIRAFTAHLRSYARQSLQMDALARQPVRPCHLLFARILLACIGNSDCDAPSSCCLPEFLSAWFIPLRQYEQVFSCLQQKHNGFLVQAVWGLTHEVLSEALVPKLSDKDRLRFHLLLPQCYPFLLVWVQFLQW